MTSTTLNKEIRELAADEIDIVAGGGLKEVLIKVAEIVFKQALPTLVDPVPYDAQHGGFHVPA